MKIKISKEKIVMTITVGIACFVLMMVMFMQFKVVEQTDITGIANLRETELRAELSNWREKYTELNERYQEVTTKISEYQNEKESDEKTAQVLETELQQINKALGKTDLEGEGIEIIIQDNEGKQLTEDVVVKGVTEEDLLKILQQLWTAGAEAISINDKRIVAMSEIVEAGGALRVNSERIISPYVIKAIGNQSYLESEVNTKGGYLDGLKEEGHEVTVERNRRVKINKFDGEIGTKYMK